MTDNPRISVITPSFNQGRYLRQCIDSVLNQNYPNLEYILIDGGSTDESVEIIKSYGDAINYWVSEPDDGQSHGINKGMSRATGDLVAWLNSDDLYLPHTFETVASAYRENSDASFYYGNGYRGDESGTHKGRFFENGTARFDRAALVYGLNYILQPSVFMSRKSLEVVDYLDEDLHYGMDSDLWLKLSKEAPPSAIAQCLSVSREYEQTKTSTGGFERAEELRQIAQRYSDLELSPGALLYYIHTMCSYMESLPATFPSQYITAVHLFWQTSALLLDQYGCGLDGMPYRTLERPEEQSATDAHEPFEVKLKNLTMETFEVKRLTTELAETHQRLADASNHATFLDQERGIHLKLIRKLETDLAESEQDRSDRLEKLMEADVMIKDSQQANQELEERVASLQDALLSAKLAREELSQQLENYSESVLGKLHMKITAK